MSNSTSVSSASALDQQRRSQIAAAAYQRGRRAALAAASRRGLRERSQHRRDIESRYGGTGDRRRSSERRDAGFLETDRAVARAAAYVAATAVAHELILGEAVPSEHDARQWQSQTFDRTAVHEDAWRERLTESGIDDFGLDPHLELDFVELPSDLDTVDFDAIAEHTLDLSATTAEIEPLPLSDLLSEAPTAEQVNPATPVNITDYLVEVESLTATASVESEVAL